MQLQYRQRSSARWGALATAAIHVLLWGVWQLAAWQNRTPAAPAAPGPVLEVQLLAGRAPPAAEVPALAAGPTAVPVMPSRAARDAVYYHLPEEVDRELILRRDPAADQAIALPRAVVLHLFVDAAGRVNNVTVEDGTLDPSLQEQLRAAFMQLVFLPAMKNGQLVAARMRIEVEAGSAPPSAVGRSGDAEVIEGQR